MDFQLLRVPIENASSLFRLRQKNVEKALGKVVDAVASDTPVPASVSLSSVLAAIESAKQATVRLGAQEAERLAHLQSRIEYCRTESRPPVDLDCAIVEYLLREGHVDAGMRVYDTALTGARRSLSDAPLLLEICAAVEALRKHDLRPALQWARDNASRLRRLDSILEFALRRQEFVELVRAKELGAALEHASQHLSPAAKAAAAVEREQTGATAAAAATATSAGPRAPGGATTAGAAASGGRPATDCLQALQEVMSILAFANPVSCGVANVERFFEAGAWEELVALFKRDALAAMGFLPRSSLEYSLALGLIALKTPSCAANAGVSVDGTPISSSSSTAAAPSASTATASLARGARGDSHSSVSSLVSRPPVGRTVVIPSQSDPSCQCPLCHPLYFASSVNKLPYCRRTVTRLLDPVTHETLNEDNPPIVLPNGRVYGTRTLELLLGSDGRYLCPLTGDTFPVDAARKAFFV